jgi:hypothetical protein
METYLNSLYIIIFLCNIIDNSNTFRQPFSPRIKPRCQIFQENIFIKIYFPLKTYLILELRRERARGCLNLICIIKTYLKR